VCQAVRQRSVAPTVAGRAGRFTVPPVGRLSVATDDVIVAESFGYALWWVGDRRRICRTVTFSASGAAEHIDAVMPDVLGESPAYAATKMYWPGALGVNSNAVPARRRSRHRSPRSQLTCTPQWSSYRARTRPP